MVWVVKLDYIFDFFSVTDLWLWVFSLASYYKNELN